MLHSRCRVSALSQSTVSQHIHRLEDLVGKSLFERDTRTVRLTQNGESPQNYAVRILDLMTEAMEHLHAPALSGHVRLVARFNQLERI